VTEILNLRPRTVVSFPRYFMALSAIATVLVSLSLLGAAKTHVSGYRRNDGTYVRGYERSSPPANSTATAHRSNSHIFEPAPAPRRTTSGHPIPGYPKGYCASCERDRHGRIERSGSEKHKFQQTQPCPATGSATGPCPGYVIDHVKPLACGGRDSWTNMQWQSAAAAKAKDKVERRSCGS
jgi:hypothetical protein